ncbi:vivid PAS protein VVD [Verticillium dahliae VdLs.17]|uniref:Vivid PAS protein VVD n=1 Tax=Verticillium dahliae (strain VdLs.17 / ATCC MYA-4575 / FGSC 10137) TaxID=498257 RepID=G2X5R5_VERDV|nr:vivid PAS protein VVD [Verticillium dahliae VdLs.17]EGY14406.1 vivid PAS protein VVD [Verticillium dahliae VdLs.17]
MSASVKTQLPVIPRSHTHAISKRPAQRPKARPDRFANMNPWETCALQFRVMGRSSPKVELGPIDCSVALVLCDLAQPDCPIVYASEAFTFLTGYSNAEILGRNCRFLQAPGGKVSRSSPRKYVDDRMVKKMRKAVEKNDEVQLEVQNFRKDGSPFMNILTMIPVTWDSEDYRYSVGFQVSRDE